MIYIVGAVASRGSALAASQTGRAAHANNQDGKHFIEFPLLLTLLLSDLNMIEISRINSTVLNLLKDD